MAPCGAASSPSVLAEKSWSISLLLLLLCLLLVLPNIPGSFLSSQLLRRTSGIPAARAKREDGRCCDYSSGGWVWDEGRRLLHGTYGEECLFLDPGFRCRRNGRKDDGYARWRWQPRRCDLPRFNASEMLARSRNRRIVFAGDSIGRNHWESLVCMLATAERNPSTIYEQNGNPITKHKGYLSIVFRRHNLTVEYYRTPFLVPVDRPPPGSPPQVKKAVRVDRLHWRSAQWAGADILVFNAGHWWNQDKTFKMGCYFQEDDRVNMTMDVREAFRRSMQTWKRWVLQSLHPQDSYIFFTSYSPVHFMGGTWDNGGRCDLETRPAAADTDRREEEDEPWSNTYISEMIEQIRAENRSAQFLNITYLTKPRSDGHPSIHREPGTAAGSPQDCSHWCLPGVPDTWNRLLFAYLLEMMSGGGHAAG